ncbi:hypothetical protein UFOVP1590_30 [uncultured Caudovirales phage]|uniref:Uncharacterized protein n=1 Tax=uncultured Caudovirales phage TaxID=2100421 RepID=A0A6J5SNQ7_9CAUD|nr:hypothetical protein UFOVP1590_30 [uncultured Caudovirales phage]
MIVVTEEAFEEWRHHPVTQRLFKILGREREEMKEGLVYDSYDNPENVKGRCQAIAILLGVDYKELMDGNK